VNKTIRGGILWIENRHEYSIHIEWAQFNSYENPRTWDFHEKDHKLSPYFGPSNTAKLAIPVRGSGRVWIRYQTGGAADPHLTTFDVTYDAQGEPFPYILGGDKWNDLLRQAAMDAPNDDSQ